MTAYKITPTYQLETTNAYYLTVSVRQESGQDLSGSSSSGSLIAAIKVAAEAIVSSEDPTGEDLLLSSLLCLLTEPNSLGAIRLSSSITYKGFVWRPP